MSSTRTTATRLDIIRAELIVGRIRWECPVPAVVGELSRSGKHAQPS